MSSHDRRLVLGALAVALLALLAWGVVAIAGESTDPVLVESPGASQGSPSLSGPFQVDGDGVGQIAVLGQPTEEQLAPAPSGAKPESQSALALSLAGQGVERSVPAHIVEQGLAGEVTVAEVGADACVGTRTLATCGSPREILEGHVVAVELCSPDLGAGSYRVLGMAPDGVQSVRIETRGGSSSTAPVRENTYEALVSDLPLLVVWQEAGGEGLSVQAPVPPGYDPSGCEG
jgi:hypothetical protein